MIPSVLMNLQFTASAVPDVPPVAGGELLGLLPLIGVGRVILPFMLAWKWIMELWNGN